MKGLEENGWTEDGEGRFERDGSVLTVDKDKDVYKRQEQEEDAGLYEGKVTVARDGQPGKKWVEAKVVKILSLIHIWN